MALLDHSPTADDSPEPPQYLKVKLPKRFALEIQTADGRWDEWAICLRERFVRNPDGSYLQEGFGSPIWFRCVEDHGDYFVHVDSGGHGRRINYRLVPLPPAE